MRKIKIEAITTRAAALLFLLLIAYLPFHIFVSTVVGVNMGGLEVLKASKDVAIAAIGLLLLPYILGHRAVVTRLLFKDWVGRLSLAFIGIHLLFFAINHRDLDSAGLGLIYNTRYIIMFLLAYLLAKAQRHYVNTSIVSKIVVASGMVVSFIGILQYYLLPRDFFARLGYSMQSGALPWFYIDDKPDFPRIMSTMRDPNSLGSYLLIPIALLLAKLAVSYKRLASSTRGLYMGAVGLLGIALVLAFSRSAVIGLVVMLVTMVAILNLGNIRRNYRSVLLLGTAAIVIFAGAGAVFLQTHPRVFKNVVLHADEETSMRDPNELRLDFLKRSAVEISENPLGSGLGMAGLASMKNEAEGVNLTENYYLQLGIEVGLVGLAVFLAINYIVIVRLYRVWRSGHLFVPLALITSFAGLFITNMLAHIWTNETIALIWWSLAAICIAQAEPKTAGKKGHKG